mgnify:CR=1 FL=1
MARHTRKRKRKVSRAQVLGWIMAIVILLVALIGVLVAGLFRLLKPAEKPTEDTPETTVVTTITTAKPTTTVSTTKKTAATTVKTENIKHYVQPVGGVWYLKLANDWNTLPGDYDQSFTAVEYGGGLSGKLFDSRAVEALRDMLAAGNAENPALKLQPVSCYRSVALQKSLYQRQVNKYLGQGYSQARAEEIAATVVKRPGQSEHNTGLAADLGGSGNYSLEESFENTAAFRWLIENCADYGFILRFPKGKEAITGVIYEPWHYRYVGKEAAKEIMEKGICLEEYLEQKGL